MNETAQCITLNFPQKPIVYIYYDNYELSTLFILFILLAYIRRFIIYT